MILSSFRDTKEGLVATFPNDSIQDRLHMRAAQLDSLISTMIGDDHFSMLGDEIQSDLLWLAGSLSTEIRELLDAQLTERVKRADERMQHKSASTTPGGIWAEINSMSDHDLTIAAQATIARAHEPEHA
ncbi:hypothetical protein [Paraburkholderia heleia]|uniref:hypothetical protein n=1 Tax=Paraburkholderia heleia TaxID=634127 RepID=UPI002AB638B6|nr:hypothetical protein [Paraburkholderia heleia]